MKNIIKKFWGVALLLVLLSTLFVGAIPQAAAMNYAWFSSFALPGSFATDLTLLANNSITAVAQSGSTIICSTTNNVTGAYTLYRSTDGGVTWAAITSTTAPTALSVFTSIAIAPDNPSIIALVSNDANAINPRPQIVWLTKNAGVNWAQLGALNANAWINDIAIAPIAGGQHNVTVGGNSVARNSANLTFGSDSAYLVTYPLDAISPTWTAPTAFAALSATDDNVLAVAYSPSYLADYALLAINYEMPVAEFVNGGRSYLHCYSYNTNLWDAAVEATFPRVIEDSAVTSTNSSLFVKAQITLDPNFFLGDEAYQIGFIGSTIQSTADNVTFTNIGGVYRMDYAAVGAANVLAQIYTGAINSVAWDGTNLMAADYNTNATMGSLVVRRSANAGPGNPIPSFSPNSAFKAPGTGFDTKLIFNATSGLGFAFSQGNGAAIAKTTDYGKSFNGYRLVNSHFGDLMDWWISPTGSVIYALTSDNVDMNLWKGSAGMFGYGWERVFMLKGVGRSAIAADLAYMVRADKDNPDNVYLGLQGGQTMHKSTDGGAAWTPRSCSLVIQDFAVQDANTVYVAVAGSNGIVKTISGALSWTDPPTGVLAAAGGVVSNLNLLSDNNVLLSGVAGGVGYTTDGVAWTYIGAPIFGGGATVPIDATGLANGDMIFVGGGFETATWTIGTSFMFNENTGIAFAGCPANGLVYANGVLYTYNQGGLLLNRWLYPTDPVFGAGVRAPSDAVAMAATYNNVGKAIINPLKATTATSFASGSSVTHLWARNANENKGTIDTIDDYTEYLTGAADAPTTNYPKNDTLIPINSISGALAIFNYTWNAPKSIADTAIATGYDYDWIVYLDEAGLNPVLAVATVYGVGVINTQLALPDPVAGAYAPGTTYYWRVRTSAGFPLQSYWSSMESFTIQQLVAIVPVIASPANGGEVTTVTPAFSWSPISNTTSYRFELASDADFTNVIYTVDPTTAGAAVPSSLSLDRGAQYYWHVKALTPMEGEWSATANFIVAQLPTEQAPPVIVTEVPAPTITAIITQPPATTTNIVINPAEVKEVNPTYIWAIIIVGAVLVIAVIILIVRTRRSV
jgi:hypothetical protein